MEINGEVHESIQVAIVNGQLTASTNVASITLMLGMLEQAKLLLEKAMREKAESATRLSLPPINLPKLRGN